MLFRFNTFKKVAFYVKKGSIYTKSKTQFFYAHYSSNSNLEMINLSSFKHYACIYVPVYCLV